MMYFEFEEADSIYRQTTVIVFDLNGLIIDDEPLQLEATNVALRSHNVHLDGNTWIKKCVGKKPLEYLPEIIGDLFPYLEAQKVIAHKDAIYRSLLACADRLVRPGFFSLLANAKANNKAVALATSTSKDGVDAILALPELNAPQFDFVICGDDVDRAKPDPMIYNKVRLHFGPAAHFLVFEDSESGVKSAAAAHMKCFAVPNFFTAKQDLSQADLIISDLGATARVLRANLPR